MPEKVLLVDDERDFLEALAERMQARGIEVSTTMSPWDALNKLDFESFDVIILDLTMPEMDGLEALEAIKKKRPNLHVILLTGRTSAKMSIEAMRLGAMDFIEKPADLKTLIEKIKTAKASRRNNRKEIDEKAG